MYRFPDTGILFSLARHQSDLATTCPWIGRAHE
jgi:hypothetical protein